MEDIDLQVLSARLPVGWDTQVMVTCTPPPEVSPRRSVVFLRKPLAGASSLADFAAAQRDELAKQLTQFSLLYDAPADLGGRSLPLIVFGWQAEAGRLTQVQGFFPATDGMVWIATLSCGAEDYDALLPEFQAVLASFAPADALVEG
ncbi:DcrB-related protein [Oceanicola sp. 502str15]|uniref:DcrB-related protein n=1 Tax=Oceanicola sp. 502str15 TaxID=2696061 RepID=UPI0020959643|nr:DcrB-related protein [Oceanicola sp. 502str15]MCO6382390.1 DcrB-related protein [Oceanicola sp. 502str15]